jgi:tetratricopeptide (TPR) repeat protein
MFFQLRPHPRTFPVLLALLFWFAVSSPLRAAEKPRLRVEDYQIDAELNPRAHKLAAKAKVKFTAIEDLSVATFELHNALRPTKVTDADGKTLSVERVTQDSTVRVSLPAGLAKDATTTVTFEYEGTLESGDDSPVSGLKLASISDDTSYLLYAGRWFPVSGYGINRFTATIRVTLPAHMVAIGSGTPAVTNFAAPVVKKGAAATSQLPQKTWTFIWDKPSFPGTVVAGIFQETKLSEAGAGVSVFFKPTHQAFAQVYGETAGKEFQFFSTLYGPAYSNNLKVVELPDDTLPAAWAPEIAAISSKAIGQKTNYRLLANTIAHQWWGGMVNPATRNDWWLSDGAARFSEARYVENAAGEAGFEEVVKDMAVGALAYDTVPLSSSGKLDPFSPEFQSLVTDKGGILLNMLRWVMGDEKFDNTMRGFVLKNAGKSVSADDFRKEAESHYGDQLTWFFSQWLDSTGAPEFKTKYTVYRLGNNKGFRIVGEISQDLDLFRMPVTLKIDTDGKSEEKRIEVVGTNSPFTIETFGKPRRIVVDPDSRVLTNSSDIKIRSSILRGQQLVQQGDLAEALHEFQKALDVDKNGSLAHYRIAEVFFMQRNYQAAANAYRESLNGDGEPRWTEVWSHIQLGKIFDVTGQRERATNEYRQAIQTNDNTEGALDEARKYLQSPYQKEKS